MKTTEEIRVLVVDDDHDTTEWMTVLLTSRGYKTKHAADAQTAEQLRESWRPHLVLMDLMLPDIEGTELLQRFRRAAPSTEIIMISGYGTVPKAVDAMKAGAFTFIEKPVDPDVLLAVLEKGIERSLLAAENRHLREQLQGRDGFANIIAKSGKMRELFQMMQLAAPTDANVLIQGESGTGKELVASALHQHSKRANGPFIRVNCAAVPSELIESELFGHRRGAFTGAVSDKVGLVELAQGGTLLLDEIAEVPQQLQVKLLRLLQEREFRQVGGSRLIKADFRLISATNASLDLPNRRLREDLFFRINTITLEIPPLRDRPEDIPLLCQHFLTKFAKEHQREIQNISSDALEAMMNHWWPGNVRELEHVLERAVIVAAGKEITRADLPEPLRQASPAPVVAQDEAAGSQTLAEIERLTILRALERTNWNKRAAADLLGVYRPTLYGKLKKYKLGEYRQSREAVSSASADERKRR